MRAFAITSAVLLLGACATPSVTVPPAPHSVAKPVTEALHGVAIPDPYRWLEDQSAPDTRAWIAAQNAHTDAILGTRPEPASFAPRITALLRVDQTTTPTWRNGRMFFTRRASGEDLYSIYMRTGGKDELLIDPAPLSADHTTSIGISDVSADGQLLAYFVRRGGADEVETRVFDVEARTDLGEPLALARYYGVAITPDHHTLIFTRATPDGPRVFRRAVTGGPEEMLFGEGYGREKIVVPDLSDDGFHLLVHVLHGSAPKKTEIYVDDLRDADGFRTVVNDLDFRSTARVAGDALVIETNWNAPNDRVMLADLASPAPAQWKEIVPENPKAAIQGVSLAGGRIYVRYLEDVKPRIAGYDLSGTKREEIAFDTLGALADVSGSWSAPVAFFSFSGFEVPPTIYQYDVARQERTVFARQNAPVDSSRFQVEQVWFASKDGTPVPMFVLSQKGLERNAAQPAILTGYGGFTQSQLPSFRASAVAWVERGGVYAVANLRGGGEFGEAWHRAGMLEQKQHTFDDFIAAAEFLVRERYTSPQHLGVVGTSNGGLLVAAIATQRPDLVAAVVCRYPLIDMIRYHRFLVGSFWVPEYGNAERAEDFSWIHAYSPYHRVREGTKYPATLFVTGDADTRVAPLHARKMAALMQAMTGGSDPILLRYHVAGGHSGGEPLPVQVKNQSEEIGFLWWQLK